MSVKQGREAKLYVAADGIGGVPTWKEGTLVRNLRLLSALGEIDLSCRGNNLKLTGLALRDVTIDFEILYDTADEAVQILEAAHTTRATVGAAVTSFGISESGSRVYKIDCVVPKWERAEDLEGAQAMSCSLKPTLSENAPTEETVA